MTKTTSPEKDGSEIDDWSSTTNIEEVEDGDKVELQAFITELKVKQTRKTELRQLNVQCCESNRPDESFFKKLDSSLKKNTAFIKKLRTLTESQRVQLIKDFDGLNLSKYVGEIATAIVDAKIKMSDVNCAIEICSLSHQRYADFSVLLLEQWRKALPQKKKDKIENASKLRVDIRFFAELLTVGVFSHKEALPMLGCLLGYLINTDKQEHNNLTTVSTFCKLCGDDFAGLVPRKFRMLSEKYKLRIPTTNIFTDDQKSKVCALINEYFDSLCKHVKSMHSELRRLERHNARSILTRGETHADSQAQYDSLKVALDKLLQSAVLFAETLDRDMPELCNDPITVEGLSAEDTASLITSVDLAELREQLGAGATGLWEDEDTRMFYENIPELTAILPKILFIESQQPSLPKLEENLEEMGVGLSGDTASTTMNDNNSTIDKKEIVKPTTVPTKGPKVSATDMLEEIMEENDEYVDELDSDLVDDTQDVSGSTMKLMMDAFITSLPNNVNRDLIDKTAIDFVTNLNTPRNRKRLVRALKDVPRVRLDLLPFYARLVAVLSPVMPDVGTELVQMLISEFKYRFRKKHQTFIESKIKVIRFIAELVKFKICPKSNALMCLKMLVFDFKHHNIDMACQLLDSSGYFLFHSAESHVRMKYLLEQIMRKKDLMKGSADQRYDLMIENAYCSCNPPSESSVQTRIKRPAIHEFIRHSLFNELDKNSVEKVLRQIRKLPWQQPAVCSYAIKMLSAPWHARYSNIHCIASLLCGLMYYREDVGHKVIDCIFEEIRVGMESNLPTLNQRRIAIIRYLGELYNFKGVDSAVIFNTLYSLISFGVSYDLKLPTSLDPPEHLFRIRLVTCLLETCGHYFDRGSTKKKLDYFLVYFQRYYWFKKEVPALWTDDRPFPIGIVNAVGEILESLRPDLAPFESLEEAEGAVNEIENEFKQKIDSILLSLKADDVIASGGGDSSDQLQSDNDIDDADLEIIDEQEDEQLSEELTREDNNDNQDSSSELDDENNDIDDDNTMVHLKNHFVNTEEDNDFVNAFDRLMQDSLQQRVQESFKMPQTEIMLPTDVKARLKGIRFADDANDADTECDNSETKTVNFGLLTKGKGSKPILKVINVSMDSNLVQSIKQREQQELEEKRQVKLLTLQRQQFMEEEEQKEAEMQIVSSIHQGKHKHSNLGTVKESSGSSSSRFQHQKGAPNVREMFKEWK